MSRENELNVMGYGYLPWRHCPNWWHNIKNFFRTFKYAWQRARYGYCDQDIWNIDYFLIELLPRLLRQLAQTTHSYPNGTTFEEWRDKLISLAGLLYNFDEANDSENEYSKKFFEVLKNKNLTEPIPQESEELSKKYYERYTEIYEKCKADRAEFFKELTKIFDDLWD